MRFQNIEIRSWYLITFFLMYLEKLKTCRQERNKLINCENIENTLLRTKKKKCRRKEMSLYRNNIASNMRRTKSIQNKLNEDEK